MSYKYVCFAMFIWVFTNTVYAVPPTDLLGVGPELTLLKENYGRSWDIWSGRAANEVAKDEVAFVTIRRDGQSGDYLVNVVFDCKSGKTYFGTAIEFRHMIVPPSQAREYVPEEVIQTARVEFCER